MVSAGLIHSVIYRDATAYSAHPHLAVASDGTWLLVFNQAPRRRAVLHPPLDPAFRNLLLRSRDEGRSWSGPEPVPGPEWAGMECAGLTPLPDGAVLLNQWQFGWVEPASLSDSPADRETALPAVLAGHWAASREFEGLHREGDSQRVADLFPLARHGGACWVHRAAHGQARFDRSVKVDTRPFSGGYGMRGAVVLPGGAILLPLSDVPHYRQIFTVRSVDGGDSWRAPRLAAAETGCEFEEPAPLLLPDGSILMLLRENASRLLHVIRSLDEGESWSRPQSIGIADYPADLLLLQDGRVAMVVGRRRPPFGIALHLSDNQGMVWQAPIMIRDDLPDRDLGYPSLVQRQDGDLVVVYYGREADGTTAILSTTLAGDFLSKRKDSDEQG